MRKQARNRTGPLQALRLAIDCMPVATREAMLEGVRSEARIIAGAYVDERGGVCPMLAAHRRGGRTDFISFARSWDRFTGARKSAREASERELRLLTAELQASLEGSSGLELDRAIAEHRRLLSAARRRRRRLLEQVDPRGEILARRLSAPQRSFAGDKNASSPARRPLRPVSALS